MKKNILFLPAALLLMGSMALTACSDDDDTAAITDTELTDAESETARAAARVLNALAEVEELPTGWASKTFDATVGEQLDAANPTVRTLAVADAAEASRYYAGITGQTLADGTTTASYSMGKLGTLNLRPSNEAGCYAVIDVDFTLMPQLKQIRLVAPSLLPDNDGGKEPYYSWGDILYDKTDDSYWICGRPANPDLGKKKTYWFSFNIKDKNYYTLSGNKYISQTVFKDLHSTSDKTIAFAEMMHLLTYGSETFPIHKYLDIHSKSLENWGLAAKEQVTTAASNWVTNNRFKEVLPKEFAESDYRAYFTNTAFFIDSYSKSGKTISTPVVNISFGSDDIINNLSAGNFKWDMNNYSSFLEAYASTGLAMYTNNINNPFLPEKALAVRMRTGRQLSTKLVGTPAYDQPLPGMGDKLEARYVQKLTKQ